MSYENLKKDIFKDVIENNYRVLNSIEKLLETKGYKDYENFNELAKQLSYDYLVKKRREYKREDLKEGEYQCENPANFPYEHSPFDKENHIDCLTAWTEDWDKISSNNIEFRYLKNLDAEFVILGKDSTGQITHKKDIEEFGELTEKQKENIKKYINKEISENPFDADKANAIDVHKLGFSPKGIKTNTNLRKSCKDYLSEDIGIVNEDGFIIPNENKNIFFTNSFVFLSAKDMSPSIIPDNIFRNSLEEFIIPLLDIIKPKAVIQGGSEAIVFSRDAIHAMIKEDEDLESINKNYEAIYKKHKHMNSSLEQLLNCTHNKMIKKIVPKEFLYHIQWNEETTTYFFPINHPSRPKYFYNSDCEKDGYYVWTYIKDYI